MKLFLSTFFAVVLVGATVVFALPSYAMDRDAQALDMPEQKVQLNAKAMVDDEIVTLGDLFDGTGGQADTAIAYAPQPGKRAYFGARWLYRVARAYGLDWRPLSQHTQAVVVRRSQVIGREEIEDAIMSAVHARGIEGDLEVALSNSMLQMHVPAGSLATVAVEDINFDSRSKRFAALLIAPVDDPNAQRLRVTGHLVQMTEVPMLNKRMLKGDVITENDIVWTKMRSDRVRKDTVLEPGDLIGKTPLRGIKSGIAIRLAEVRHPLLVEKGDVVTLVLQSRGMQLTAQGKALEHGSDGDTIRVTNLQSSQVVDATVIGAGRLAVTLNNQMAMSR